jgi:hypothetical protein
MYSILRVLGPLLFSSASRFVIPVLFITFGRYGRRFWRWFWE